MPVKVESLQLISKLPMSNQRENANTFAAFGGFYYGTMCCTIHQCTTTLQGIDKFYVKELFSFSLLRLAAFKS